MVLPFTLFQRCVRLGNYLVASLALSSWRPLQASRMRAIAERIFPYPEARPLFCRGNIKIQNRKGLEECACECYSAIRERIFGVGQASVRDVGQSGY